MKFIQAFSLDHGGTIEIRTDHISAVVPLNNPAGEQALATVYVNGVRALDVWVGEYEPDRDLSDNIDLFWLLPTVER